MRLIIFIMFLFIFSYNSYGQTDTLNGARFIPKTKLINNSELNEKISGYNSHFEVISYSVSTIINGYCYVVKNKGAKFTQAVINLIKKSKSGEKIYFEEIKVRGLDGRILIMEPLIFRIK